MIKVTTYKDKNVIVLGLGKTGQVAARALMAGGANVIVWDDSQSSLAQASVQGFTVADPSMFDWDNIDALLVSPGIPLNYPAPHPLVENARNLGVPIISDIDLLRTEQNQCKFIGITGTNGKSTTTSLIGHILEQNYYEAAVGGNIGIAALDLNPLTEEGFYVLELSSYQLDITKNLDLNAAILLNITPDHLKRHGNMMNYANAKKNIFNFHKPGGLAVVGIDTPDSKNIYNSLLSSGHKNLVAITEKKPMKGAIYLSDGCIIDNAFADNEIAIDQLTFESIVPRQNFENLAAAYAVLRHFGLSRQMIVHSLKSFQSLAHRQELTARIDRITFINDSKATNVPAVEQALKNYNNMYLILGGRSKGESLKPIIKYADKINHIFLIGEAADSFAVQLEDEISYTIVYNMEEAVNSARTMALNAPKSSPVVILSPACESYDQFNNFEHRGDTFKQIVANLPGLHQALPRNENNLQVLEIV